MSNDIEREVPCICKNCNAGYPYISVIKGLEKDSVSYSLTCLKCPNKVMIKHEYSNLGHVQANREDEIYNLWNKENSTKKPKLATVHPIDEDVNSVENALDKARAKNYDHVVIIGLNSEDGVTTFSGDVTNSLFAWMLIQAMKEI